MERSGGGAALVLTVAAVGARATPAARVRATPANRACSGSSGIRAWSSSSDEPRMAVPASCAYSSFSDLLLLGLLPSSGQRISFGGDNLGVDGRLEESRPRHAVEDWG